MKLATLLPRDKFDLKSVEKLGTVGFPEINSIVPELLNWTKDMNWPVAEPIASLLADAGPEIIPQIQKILVGDDPIWKHAILTSVVPSLETDAVLQLEFDLQRLALEPTRLDIIENVDAAAKEVLSIALGKQI